MTIDEGSAECSNDERRRTQGSFVSFGFSALVRASAFVLRHFFMMPILHDELVHIGFHSKR